jgi:TrmH family RNA methyltransferase
MTLLTSRQNPKIKQIRSLGSRKRRQEQGVFVVEGIRHVGEAVESGAWIDFLLYAPELLTSDYAYSLITQLKLKNIPVFSTTPDIFADLADKEHPQGILAVVRQKIIPLESLSKDNFSWGVAIVSPQDPGNLGTLMRTLDAAGADGLIVLEQGTDIYHPTSVRASMGTIFWKPVVYATLAEFRAWQNVNNFHLYGTSAKGSVNFTEANYERPAILLLGSEREGLNEEQIAMCDSLVSLPMRGHATSLNLSVAAGILLYEMGEKLNSGCG